jgi:translation initiation factor IF-2
VVIGHAQVRTVFRIPRKGNIAGSYVLDGQVNRNALARIRRNGDEIYSGRVASLRRFTEDVREVVAGYECGISLEGFNDFHEGDTIEFYVREQQ